MARSAGPRPRGLSRQAARLVVAITAWSTGTSAPSNGVGSPGSPPAANAVAVTITAGFEPRQRGAHETAAARPSGSGRRAARARARARPAPAKRIDRRDVGGKQHRAIEQDRHSSRPCRRQRVASRSRSTAPLAWQIAGHPRHRLRLGRIELRARHAAQAAAAARACSPARPRGNSRSSASSSCSRQGRCVGEARIVAVLAGQQCKRDAAFARERRRAGRPRSATNRDRRAGAPR